MFFFFSTIFSNSLTQVQAQNKMTSQPGPELEQPGLARTGDSLARPKPDQNWLNVSQDGTGRPTSHLDHCLTPNYQKTTSMTLICETSKRYMRFIINPYNLPHKRKHPKQ